MSHPSLVAHVQQATLLEPAATERLLVAVLGTLAGTVRATAREALRAALPALGAAEVLRDSRPAASAAALTERVAEALAVDALRAREYAQIALAQIAGQLDEELADRLRRDLPADVAALLQRDAPKAAPPPVRAGAHGHRLADGKPGSRQPLSEGKPGSTHDLSQHAPLGGHANSVVADNPHADTKLSSARGLTQEREDETLARGKPAAR